MLELLGFVEGAHLNKNLKKKTRNRARNAMEERRQTAFSLEDIPDCS